MEHFKKTYQFTHSISATCVKPGDLILYNGRLMTAVNPTSDGYLYRDCLHSEPMVIQNSESVLSLSNGENK